MHLKSLELAGFKSFAEAKIEFPRGITAVVGPNGTGKSNIVDAILWVLGEQSTKTLRSERMEDVIFNGTQSRKPLGMVEVSLVLAGLGGEKVSGVPGLPDALQEYNEIMISRRLYRDGTSEYLLNKVPCRLKDIRAVLLDTRAGVKGHTVIEQGRIDQILNASPQERRELIEETAGIVRYKKQKAEALRKLDATQQNLLRVRDVVAEVRRQLNSLERQARQARAYQRHYEDAKALEIRLLVRDVRRLMALQAQVEAELAVLVDQEAVEAAEESRLGSEVEGTRSEITARQEALNRLREQLATLEQEQSQALTAVEVERSRVELYESQRRQSSEERDRVAGEQRRAGETAGEIRERLARTERELAEGRAGLAGLEANGQALLERRDALSAEAEQRRRDILDSTVRLTTLQSQMAQLDERRAALTGQADRARAEDEALREQIEEAARQQRIAADERGEGERRAHELRGLLAVCEDERRAMDQQWKTAGEEASRAQEAVAAAESRLLTLESVVREEMGYGRVGEEESTSLRACAGVREAVAEWLRVPPGLERAVEAVLGERGRAWLVDHPRGAVQAVGLLKEKQLGRGSFIPLEPRWAAASERPADLAHSRPGVLGWAVDLIGAGAAGETAMARLFEGVLVVDSLESALDLWEGGSLPRGIRIVTVAGEWLDATGVITGGQTEGVGGLLQRRKELQDVTAHRDAMRARLQEARRQRDEAEARAEAARARLQACEEDIRSVEMRLLAADRDRERAEHVLGELARRLAACQADADRARREAEDIEAEAIAKRRELERVQGERTARETGLEELTATLAVVEAEHLDMQQRLTEARLRVAALQATLERDQGESSRILDEQAERHARLQALERQLAELAAAQAHSRQEQERSEARARELGAEADRLRADYVSAQERLAELQEQVRRGEERLGEARKRLTARREARLQVEVRRAELKTQVQTGETTLSGTYQLSLDAALALEPHERERRLELEEGRPEEDVTAALREELQALRGKLDRMGPINLAAIEEHDALEERHRFLTTQEQDLSKSMASLREIIGRINRTTERMFLETFNELQEKFGEVFGRLFPGGRAELVLTEPEAPASEEEQGPREPGVDIVAQPPGKRLKNITMLSGGEKSLTAMALIFASFLIRPTPFCILDEIDAPLDEENIGRFADVLRELSQRAQFIVITHNKRTMSVADSLFGVTMEEPGVSQLISIRLADLQPA